MPMLLHRIMQSILLVDSEMSNYSLGFSYTSQEGIYGAPVEPNFERYTTRINSDHVIYNNDKWDVIKVGETLLFNFNQRNGIGIGNIYWERHSQYAGCKPFNASLRAVMVTITTKMMLKLMV